MLTAFCISVIRSDGWQRFAYNSVWICCRNMRQVANMRGRISWSRDLRQCLVDIQAFRPLWPTCLATEAKGEQNNRCSFNGGKLSLFAGEINRNGWKILWQQMWALSQNTHNWAHERLEIVSILNNDDSGKMSISTIINNNVSTSKNIQATEKLN